MNDPTICGYSHGDFCTKPIGHNEIHVEGSCPLCTGYHDAAEAAFMNGKPPTRPAASGLREALELVTKREPCPHGYLDVVHVAPAHFDGPACPQCSDAPYADEQQRLQPCEVCAALAAPAPALDPERLARAIAYGEGYTASPMSSYWREKAERVAAEYARAGEGSG